MYTAFITGVWSMFLQNLSRLIISFDGVTISFLAILVACVFFDIVIEIFDGLVG